MELGKEVKTEITTIYTLKLSERELLTLWSALTVSDMKKSSDLLVRRGLSPTFLSDGGDDLHYTLYQTVAKVVDELEKEE